MFFRYGVSAKEAGRSASIAAGGEYRHAMEAINPNPVASGRGVHDNLLSRLHPQHDDDLADVLSDPFFLPRIEIHAPEVDIM
jgi:hypothetical protein